MCQRLVMAAKTKQNQTKTQFDSFMQSILTLTIVESPKRFPIESRECCAAPLWYRPEEIAVATHTNLTQCRIKIARNAYTGMNRRIAAEEEYDEKLQMISSAIIVEIIEDKIHLCMANIQASMGDHVSIICIDALLWWLLNSCKRIYDLISGQQIATDTLFCVCAYILIVNRINSSVSLECILSLRLLFIACAQRSLP